MGVGGSGDTFREWLRRLCRIRLILRLWGVLVPGINSASPRLVDDNMWKPIDATKI